MTIVAKAFTNETIITDGLKFIDCEFRKCIPVYRGGPVPVFDGSFLDNCDWRFEENALRTIIVLQRINASGGWHIVEALFPDQKTDNAPHQPCKDD